MKTAGAALVVLLVLVMFDNYAAGTLGQWFRAKFLNQKPAGA